MTVYVDTMRRYTSIRNPRVAVVSNAWCHMTADTENELHEMAHVIGMSPQWYQVPRRGELIGHYDLTPRRRVLAVAKGAVEISRKELVMKIRRERMETQADW